MVPLSDGAGEVAAVGEGVTRVKVGDRVCPTFFQVWTGGRPPVQTWKKVGQTRSPTFTRVTPSPTAATSPAPSDRGTIGRVTGVRYPPVSMIWSR